MIVIFRVLLAVVEGGRKHGIGDEEKDDIGMSSSSERT